MSVSVRIFPTSLNLLSRGTVAASSSGDTLYPSSNLYDSVPSSPFKSVASTGQTVSITVDISVLENGNFETWTSSSDLSSWTRKNGGLGSTSSMLVVRSTDVASTGSSFAANTRNAASASYSTRIYQDQSFSPGESVVLETYLHSDGLGSSGVSTIGDTRKAGVLIQNLQTGNCLTSSGGWAPNTWDPNSSGTTVSYSVSSSSTTYELKTITFTVESVSIDYGAPVTLRTFMCTAPSSGSNVRDAWFDSSALWPTLDFISVHGHKNLTSAAITSSTDGSTYSTGASFGSLTLRQPAFYGILAAADDNRYQKITITGNHVGPVEVGEIVMGKLTALTRPPDNPVLTAHELKYIRDQVRSETLGGSVYAYNMSSQPRRALRLPFTFTDSTEFEDHRQKVRTASNDGSTPIVVIPSTEETTVIMGHIDSSWDVRRVFENPLGNEADLFIVEDGFPITVS